MQAKAPRKSYELNFTAVNSSFRELLEFVEVVLARML